MPRITDWTGIVKTPYGYRVRVLIRPHPEKSKRFGPNASLGEMQRWREDAKREIGGRRHHRAGTIGADAKVYLREWKTGKHPQTVEQRTRYLELWADAFHGRNRRDITTAMVRAQLAKWKAHGLPVSEYAAHRKRGVSRLKPDTVNKVRQALYQLYAHLDAGTDAKNPVADVPTERPADPEPRNQDPEVWRAIFRHMPRCATKARLQVMVYAGGLRPEEVRRIKPIDWAGGWHWFVRTAKNGQPATVPLTRRGRASLRYFWRLKAFGGFTSAPMARMLHEAQAKAGYAERHIVPYDLRHSFGTWHYATFKDFKATQEAMRHKSGAMTMRYVKGAVSAVQAASRDALDAALRASRRSERRH